MTAPNGASAAASVLAPLPERMSDFLPLWHKRNAHIEARDAALSRRETEMLADGGVSPGRLLELADIAATHEAEVAAITAQMAALQYQP